MRKQSILSPQAIDDLNEIWHYTAGQSESTIADRLEDEFFDAFDLLAQFPKAGHPRQDLTERPVLFFSVRKYLLVYQGTPEELIIHAVLHTARNIKSVLGRRGK